MVVLESQSLRLEVRPELGAGVADFSWREGTGPWVPVWRRASASDGSPDQLACVVQAPWTGRLTQGKFEFGARLWSVTDHGRSGGLVKDLAWALLDRSPQSVRLERDVEPGEAGWPWGFRARVRYELAGDTLRALLEVTSQSSAPMPLGLGFGPAWNRRVGSDADRFVARVNVHGRGGVEFGAADDAEIDECFVSADGAGEIWWEGSGLRASWTCSPELSHVWVRTPPGLGGQGPANHVEVHPVSMASGGFEMLAHAQAFGGVAVLQSGETMRAAWSVRVERAGTGSEGTRN